MEEEEETAAFGTENTFTVFLVVVTAVLFDFDMATGGCAADATTEDTTTEDTTEQASEEDGSEDDDSKDDREDEPTFVVSNFSII